MGIVFQCFIHYIFSYWWYYERCGFVFNFLLVLWIIKRDMEIWRCGKFEAKQLGKFSKTRENLACRIAMLMQVVAGFFAGFGFVSVFVVRLPSFVRLCFSLLKGL